MEEQRGLGLVDERGDVADIDRLVQVDELAGLAQAIEKLAEVFLHRSHAAAKTAFLQAWGKAIDRKNLLG
jgi:hypothetical protein